MLPLYVSRPVLNAKEIAAYARSLWLRDVIAPEDMHVSICYSREPLHWPPPFTDGVTITNPTGRDVVRLGDAIALQFDSPFLEYSWRRFLNFGASWDYESYTPHLSLSYSPEGVDVSHAPPWMGQIELGGEVFEELKLDDAEAA